jgi:hypothetical protein
MERRTSLFRRITKKPFTLYRRGSTITENPIPNNEVRLDAAQPPDEIMLAGSLDQKRENPAQSEERDGENNIEIKVDYSYFDVMGPSYPEPDFFRGKPCITTKIGRDVQGTVVGIGSKLFDRTVGMRLFNTKTNMLVLVNVEEAFKYVTYVTCSYTWKHDLVEQNLHVKEIVRRVAEKATWVWIDAWCIDQEAEEDKRFNIQLMGKIFRYSAKNFIMLLDCVVDQEVGDLLRDLGTRTKYILSQFKAEGDKGLLRLLIEESGDENVGLWMRTQCAPSRRPSWQRVDFQRLLEALRCILSHKWVTRMWTFQEAILGTDNLVIGTNWWCNYEALEYGIGVLDWYNENQKGEQDYIKSKLKIIGLLDLSKRWRRLYFLGPDVTAGELIHRTAGRTCGVQEDRIYAIKGLLSYGDQIAVRYGNPDGLSNAAYTLAQVCCKNGDYSWAGGFNVSGLPGNISALGIPGVTMMPRGIGSWKATQLFASVGVSSIGVARSGRICLLEAHSDLMNAVAMSSYQYTANRFSEGEWENTYIAAAAAVLAAFGAGGLVNGFLTPDQESKYARIRVPGSITVGCTQEVIDQSATYFFNWALGSNTIEQPELAGDVLLRVGRSLEYILPYGWRTAGIVRIRRYGDHSGRNMLELCNLLYWPLLDDLTGVRVLGSGNLLEHETFAVVRLGLNGILKRVGTAIALIKGNLSDAWGEQQPIVEG